MDSPQPRRFTIAPGEEARLTPEGPTAALIESRGPLPLRCRSTGAAGRVHPGTAVALGASSYEVVDEEVEQGRCVYRLEPWPRDQVVRDRVVYGPRLVGGARQQRSRESRERWAGPALRLVSSVLEAGVALLPAAERNAASERLSLNPQRGTLLLIPLQLFGAAVLWVIGFVAAGQARLESVAGQYTRAATAPSDQELARAYAPFQGGSDSWSPEGLLLLAYVLTPQALLLEYVFLTGLVRALNLAANRQSLADPLLALTLGLRRWGAQRLRERARLSRLGPERPDRVLADGHERVVLAARPKAGWDERATIQVGGAFYRLRSVSERADGEWLALAYRLAPLAEGSVIRGLVHHEAQALPKERAPAAPPPEPRPTQKPPEGGVRFRVDDGEEARLTPLGPTSAVIESRGSLPLRPRSVAVGVHHRPEFPGSCVQVGVARYEVVEEQALESGVRYLLQAWPDELVIRDVVTYGPRLVRAAQQERLRAVDRERASRWSFLLAPLVGLLPEQRQLLACDRLGLDPGSSMIAGIGLELCLAALIAISLPGGRAPMGPLLLVGSLIVAPALYRLLGALLFREVSGNLFLGAALAALDSAEGSGARADATVLPLTREAFWTRLSRPDRIERRPDGSLMVRSLLPHLSWVDSAVGRAMGAAPALRVGGDHWHVAPLPSVIEQGRLVYSYELRPYREPEMRSDLEDPPPPDPRQYQSEVLEQVAREWDDVFAAAPWLVSLLPRAVQERAYRGRSGPASAQRWTLNGAFATLALALWFLLGKGPLAHATGLVCAFDGVRRCWLALRGDYAPSWIGPALSGYLRPERVAYQAHLAAERQALLAGRPSR